MRAPAEAVPYARDVTGPDRWPPLPYEDWLPTKQTVHRYTQMVGKVRMALVPFRNHWWHVTLYVTARGLSTGPMPAGDREAEIAFDLVDHRLVVTTSDGGHRALDLTRRPACADVYADLFAALDDLGDSPPFDEDREHRDYDPDAVHRWWRVLAMTQRVLDRFRGRFAGKASPVHLFWHGFDLAHARYSGRPAPVPEGADPVGAEAYSHEVVAFGFWPGDDRLTPYPAFYSYTSPEPDGLRDHPPPRTRPPPDAQAGSGIRSVAGSKPRAGRTPRGSPCIGRSHFAA